MLGFQTYVFSNIQGFLNMNTTFEVNRNVQTPEKNEILECQGGHLRQFQSQILAYSLLSTRQRVLLSTRQRVDYSKV